jgi:hypothetical protein
VVHTEFQIKLEPIDEKVLSMVEAGGVEPPSEEPNGQETTCLSRSLPAFADGPKERATTNRRLASIPPKRILPETPRR